MPIEITPSSSDPALAAYDSPIGCLTLAARGGALVGLWVTGQRFFGSPYGIDEASARSALDLTSPDSREVVLAPAGGTRPTRTLWTRRWPGSTDTSRAKPPPPRVSLNCLPFLGQQN